jgi:hypothetical protein
MSLRDRFVVGEVLRDGPIRSYAARDAVSGKQVVIHLELIETSEALLDVALAHESGNIVLEQGVDNDVPYVIIERHQRPREDPFLERRVWKASVPVAEPAGPPAAAGPSPATAAPEATRLFQATDFPPKQEQPPPPPVDRSKEVTVTVVVPIASAAAPVEPAYVPTNEPGEFTRVFQAPLGGAPSTTSRVEPPPAVAKPASDPGEFSRVFQAPLEVAASTTSRVEPPPAVANPADDGEFTRLFLVQSEKAPSEKAPAQKPAAPAPAPVPRVVEQQTPAAEAGEFTRMFQTPGGNVPPNPPPPVKPIVPSTHATSVFQTPNRTSHPVDPAPPPLPAAGEFTGLFKTPAQTPTPQPFPPAPPAAPPPAPSPGAGEFTALFRSPVTPPASSNPEPPPGFGSNQIFPDMPRVSSGAQAAPGSFTQFFQSPAFPSAPVADSRQAAPLPPMPYDPLPPPPAPSGYGRPSGSVEATGVFQSSRPQPAQFQGGASEYTKMFSTPAPVSFQEPKPVVSAPSAPEPAKDNTKLILILIIGAVLFVAILLIVYFVWFRGTPSGK